MLPVIVHTQFTKSDLIWNQIYWWYRGLWKRILFCLGIGFLFFVYFFVNKSGNDDPHGLIPTVYIFAITVGMVIGFIFSYLADAIIFALRNFWITAKHKKMLYKEYTTTFSTENVTTEYTDGKSTTPYDHYEKIFFYKRHIIFKPTGVPNFYHMIKWSDIPNDQKQELKDLLTTKISKAIPA
jgi:hypothetical protein